MENIITNELDHFQFLSNEYYKARYDYKDEKNQIKSLLYNAIINVPTAMQEKDVHIGKVLVPNLRTPEGYDKICENVVYDYEKAKIFYAYLLQNERNKQSIKIEMKSKVKTSISSKNGGYHLLKEKINIASNWIASYMNLEDVELLFTMSDVKFKITAKDTVFKYKKNYEYIFISMYKKDIEDNLNLYF